MNYKMGIRIRIASNPIINFWVGNCTCILFGSCLLEVTVMYCHHRVYAVLFMWDHGIFECSAFLGKKNLFWSLEMWFMGWRDSIMIGHLQWAWLTGFIPRSELGPQALPEVIPEQRSRNKPWALLCVVPSSSPYKIK